MRRIPLSHQESLQAALGKCLAPGHETAQALVHGQEQAWPWAVPQQPGGEGHRHPRVSFTRHTAFRFARCFHWQRPPQSHDGRQPPSQRSLSHLSALSAAPGTDSQGSSTVGTVGLRLA